MKAALVCAMGLRVKYEDYSGVSDAMILHILFLKQSNSNNKKGYSFV